MRPIHLTHLEKTGTAVVLTRERAASSMTRITVAPITTTRVVKLRLAESALDDIAAILYVSEEHFGAAAAGRYRELVRQALDDISERPTGPLSVARPELGDGIRLWHLRNSRDRPPS